MPRGSYILRDATDDSSARERANHAPELSEALVRLGFYSVGVIEAVLNQPGQASQMFSNMDTADAEQMIRVVQQGEAVEITTSHDALMFGVAERTVASPVLSLQTIFDNGMVVETTMRPERAPRPADRGDTSLPSRALVSVMRVLTGAPPIWPRANCPASGFFVELVETRDARVLYDRHLARLKNICDRYHASIPHQDSLDVYRAIRLRFRQMVRHQTVWAQVLTNIIAVVMVLSVIFVPRSTSLMDILFIMYACSLGLLAIGLVNRVLIPEIHVPLKPLNVLLRQQEAEWGPVNSHSYL